MSLFGKNLERAETRITGLLALFATIGFPIKADADLPSAEALTAHLTARENSAVTAATTPLNEKLIAAQAAKLAESYFRAGLEASGVKLTAAFVTADGLTAEEKKDKTPEQISALVASKNAALVTAAVDVTVAAKAAAKITEAGHDPLALEPTKDDDTKPTATTTKGKTKAQLMEQMAKLPVNEQRAFYVAHIRDYTPGRN